MGSSLELDSTCNARVESTSLRFHLEAQEGPITVAAGIRKQLRILPHKERRKISSFGRNDKATLSTANACPMLVLDM